MLCYQLQCNSTGLQNLQCTNKSVCLSSKISACSCIHSMVNVNGLRLYTTAINPLLLHTNCLTASCPLECTVSANLLTVAQIWSLNAQQHLMLTDTRACTTIQVSKSENAVCQEIKKWKRIESCQIRKVAGKQKEA